MMIQKKNKLFTTGLVALLVLLLPRAAAAEGITIEEAINRGLKNNKELRTLAERISGLKRELEIIKARQDIQVELDAGYRATFPDEGRSNLSADIKLSKIFSSGLTVKPGINLTENDSGLSLDIIQPLFPYVPTDLSRQYYKTTKELIKTEENLTRQKTEKILSWLESYLNICRLQERRDVYQTSVEMAVDNRNKVRAEKEIGEAGERDILTAEVSLKNAEYARKEMDYRIEEARLALVQDLGIEDTEDLVIEAQSPFFQELAAAVEELVAEYLEQSDILQVVEMNDYQLLVNRIDREVLTRELAWLKKENGPALNATGGYNTINNKLTVGLSLTYKIHDGGERRLRLAEKEAALAGNDTAYNDQIDSLKLQLKKHLNTLDLGLLELDKERLVRQRSQHDAEVAEKQLEMGLIDYLEYQEHWLGSEEAEINLRSLEDRLFITNLHLIHFINSARIMGGLWHD